MRFCEESLQDKVNYLMISDQGLNFLNKPLSRFESLLQIDLSGTQLDDQRVSMIGFPKSTIELDISQTLISDESLAEICQVEGIRSLKCRFNRVTDRGIMLLRNCRMLKQLDLTGSTVSRIGVISLTCAVPQIKIGEFSW
jgi:hypothetical protein